MEKKWWSQDWNGVTSVNDRTFWATRSYLNEKDLAIELFMTEKLLQKELICLFLEVTAD